MSGFDNCPICERHNAAIRASFTPDEQSVIFDRIADDEETLLSEIAFADGLDLFIDQGWI